MHPKLVEIAENDLRETESRKIQLLQQFRDWIEKHPFIVSSKRDDNFLLAFLRQTKYNLDKACQKYEKTFIMMRKYPTFYQTDADRIEKCFEVIKKGYIYAVPGFDDEGSKVVIVRIGQRDPDDMSVALIMESSTYMLTTLLSTSDENQIAKYKVIIDFENVTMKKMLNAMENKIVLEMMTTGLSMRISKFISINFPPIVQSLADVVRMMASEKINKRSVSLKDHTLLGEHIKPIAMLPKIYGGNQNESEITENLVKTMLEDRENFIEMLTFEIAEDKIPRSKLVKDEYENVGSFVKLEID